MDEVRSTKLGVRLSAADRISTGLPDRSVPEPPAVNPVYLNLGVAGAVLAAAIGITVYIWYGVAVPGAPAATPAATETEAPASSDAAPPEVIAQVQDIERLLTDLGFTPGPVDGVLDPATADAIRAYQQAAGLTEDGRATPELLEELKAVAGE